MYDYSADFPGPLRDVVRRVLRGGRIPPGRRRERPTEGGLHGGRARGGAHGRPARDRGPPLARGALRDPRRMVHRPERSIMQISSYRRAAAERARSSSPRRCGDVRSAPASAEPRRRPCRLRRVGAEARRRRRRRQRPRRRRPDRVLARGLGAQDGARAAGRDCPDVSRGAHPRDPGRRRCDRFRPGRGVQRDRDGRQRAQPRHADHVRRLHKRLDRLLRDRGRVRARRVRGRLQLPRARKSLTRRAGVRTDPRRDRCAGGREPLPRGDSVGRRARVDGDRRRAGPAAPGSARRIPTARSAQSVPISSRLASTARRAESGCRITGIPHACGIRSGTA